MFAHQYFNFDVFRLIVIVIHVTINKANSDAVSNLQKVFKAFQLSPSKEMISLTKSFFIKSFCEIGFS
jgi:hypothetical protein